MQKLLCTSHNGIEVTYDPIDSHAATHLEDTPQLGELVSEIVGDMDLTGQTIRKHFDMGKVIGTSDVVTVDETDELVYAVRKNRNDDGLVPFTKSRQAQPCNFVTVQLSPHPDGTYELLSAWIGTFDDDDQPFPQSPAATSKSVEFWNNLAFVYGSQEIVPGSETSNRPW